MIFRSFGFKLITGILESYNDCIRQFVYRKYELNDFEYFLKFTREGVSQCGVMGRDLYIWKAEKTLIPNIYMFNF